MKKATITVSGIKFYSYHGCFDEEQRIGANFIVDARIVYDAERAVENDDVEQSVNYQLVYYTIQEIMRNPTHLLETVANNIITSIKERFPEVLNVSVTVKKVNPPLENKTDFVAVEMEG